MKKIILLLIVACFALITSAHTCPDPPVDPKHDPHLYLKSDFKKVRKEAKPFKPDINKLLAPEPVEDKRGKYC